MNCPLYGASSCKYKTYNISIRNHSFWSINYSESLVNILKGFSWKWFCEDVLHLLFFSHIFNSDVLLYNLFPQKVILDLRYWWCLYYHNRLEWVHHTQPVYLSNFVSSIGTMYNMLLVLQYNLLGCRQGYLWLFLS